MKYRLKIPFYLAWQYINRGRKWTLILTIFLLSAAFVNLLFISSLFGGVVSGADQKIRDTTTGDIYITPKQGEETIDDVASILSKLNKIDGVKATSSNTLVPGALTYDSITGQGSVYAIEPSDDKSVRTLYSSISPGNWLEDDDADVRERRVGVELAGEQALGDEAQAGVLGGGGLEADLRGLRLRWAAPSGYEQLAQDGFDLATGLVDPAQRGDDALARLTLFIAKGFHQLGVGPIA